MDLDPDPTSGSFRWCWTFTADHMPDRFEDDLKPLVVSLVGLVGPEDCDLTSEEIVLHPNAKAFRLSDSIGLMYEGYLLGEVGDLPPTTPGKTEPWLTLCRGWACTVKLFQNGAWQRTSYLGMFFDDWSPFGL